jgi:hypothetical protein
MRENSAAASGNVIQPRSPSGKGLIDAESTPSLLPLSLRVSGGTGVRAVNAALTFSQDHITQLSLFCRPRRCSPAARGHAVKPYSITSPSAGSKRLHGSGNDFTDPLSKSG